MTEEEAKAEAEGDLEQWILNLLLGFNPIFTNKDKVAATKKIAAEVRGRVSLVVKTLQTQKVESAILTRPPV